MKHLASCCIRADDQVRAGLGLVLGLSNMSVYNLRREKNC